MPLHQYQNVKAGDRWYGSLRERGDGWKALTDGAGKYQGHQSIRGPIEPDTREQAESEARVVYDEPQKAQHLNSCEAGLIIL